MTVTVADPATAIATGALTAFAEFMRFLQTPEGQALAADIRQLTWDRLVRLLPDPRPLTPVPASEASK